MRRELHLMWTDDAEFPIRVSNPDGLPLDPPEDIVLLLDVTAAFVAWMMKHNYDEDDKLRQIIHQMLDRKIDSCVNGGSILQFDEHERT